MKTDTAVKSKSAKEKDMISFKFDKWKIKAKLKGRFPILLAAVIIITLICLRGEIW